jgi:hypothetical protein
MKNNENGNGKQINAFTPWETSLVFLVLGFGFVLCYGPLACVPFLNFLITEK